MNALSIPEQVTVKLFITASRDLLGKTVIGVSDVDHSKYNDGQILITTHDVTLDIPPIDVTGIEIETLHRQQQQIADIADRRIENIENQIRSLLSIEHKPDLDTPDSNYIPF